MAKSTKKKFATAKAAEIHFVNNGYNVDAKNTTSSTFVYTKVTDKESRTATVKQSSSGYEANIETTPLTAE